MSRSADIVHMTFRYQIADSVWYHSSAAAPLDEGESSLAEIADWGPAEDWSDWADAAG